MTKKTIEKHVNASFTVCIFSVCVHKATGKNPSSHRQDQEDMPRTPMMQHRPLVLRPESITRFCRLN